MIALNELDPSRFLSWENRNGRVHVVQFHQQQESRTDLKIYDVEAVRSSCEAQHRLAKEQRDLAEFGPTSHAWDAQTRP